VAFQVVLVAFRCRSAVKGYGIDSSVRARIADVCRLTKEAAPHRQSYLSNDQYSVEAPGNAVERTVTDHSLNPFHSPNRRTRDTSHLCELTKSGGYHASTQEIRGQLDHLPLLTSDTVILSQRHGLFNEVEGWVGHIWLFCLLPSSERRYAVNFCGLNRKMFPCSLLIPKISIAGLLRQVCWRTAPLTVAY